MAASGGNICTKCVELQVHNDNMSRRVSRLTGEISKLEQKLRDSQDELISTQEYKNDIQDRLQEKSASFERASQDLVIAKDTHRAETAALRLSAMKGESAASRARQEVAEVKEELRECQDRLLEQEALVEKLRRQIEEGPQLLGLGSGRDEVEEFKKREERLVEQHRSRIAEERRAAQEAADEVRKAHEQAVKFLQHRVKSLEEQTAHDSKELAKRKREHDASIKEYEQAIEELEAERETDVAAAREEAAKEVRAEIEIERKEWEEERREIEALREELDEARRGRSVDVERTEEEWAGVYRELEELYFAEKEEAEQKRMNLQKLQTMLAITQERVRELEEERKSYDDNLSFLKHRLDTQRSAYSLHTSSSSLPPTPRYTPPHTHNARRAQTEGRPHTQRGGALSHFNEADYTLNTPSRSLGRAFVGAGL